MFGSFFAKWIIKIVYLFYKYERSIDMAQLILQVNDVSLLPTIKKNLSNVKGVKVTEVQEETVLQKKAKKLNSSVKKNNVTMNTIVSEVRTVRNGKK